MENYEPAKQLRALADTLRAKAKELMDLADEMEAKGKEENKPKWEPKEGELVWAWGDDEKQKRLLFYIGKTNDDNCQHKVSVNLGAYADTYAYRNIAKQAIEGE